MSRSMRRSKVIRANVRRTPAVLLLIALAVVIAADRFIGLGMNGFDYAALILVTLFALKGYLQGLVNTVFSLLGYILGAIGASLLSPSAAAWAMNHTGIGKGLSERLDKLLPILSDLPVGAPGTTTGIASALSFLEKNPNAQKALQEQPLLLQAFQTANPSFMANGSLMKAPVENLNDWLVYSLLRIMAVFILFLLLKLLFVLVGKLITSLMNLSVVMGTANRTAGMALGLLVGFIVLYMLAGTIIPFLGSLEFIKVPPAFAESKVLVWFNALVAFLGSLR